MIDTHAHLDQLENIQEALREASIAGVKGIVAVSMDAASCQKNFEIKQKSKSPEIYLAMGMHPSEADLQDLPQCIELIKGHQAQLKAVGEIGLDFWYKWVRKDQQKKDEQREVFRTLLKLAKELNLPAVIHSRGAWRECLETAKETGIKKAVFHWYSGPVDVLKEILDQGYFVSASPSLAYSPQSREAILESPIEQTLIETDCPVYFQGSETEPGFQAQPKDVFRTLKAYCALKNVREQETLKQFNGNAEEFFGINLGKGA